VHEVADVRVDEAAASISIDLKTRPGEEGEVCLAVTRTDARAFAFDSLAVVPGGTTYAVSVNGLTASFVYDPLLSPLGLD
jgi:hypothetical protein